jgi:NADH dehydrogenase (ubiquinone) Fe-S protein 5
LLAVAAQAARAKMLQAAYRQAEARKIQENPPTAGQIRNLGLLDREDDTKKVVGTS